MAEEQEDKKKPKATLIKHKKPEESAPEAKPEKKRVVVVKKKKKPVPRVVAKKEEPSVDEQEKKAASSKAKPEQPKPAESAEPKSVEPFAKGSEAAAVGEAVSAPEAEAKTEKKKESAATEKAAPEQKAPAKDEEHPEIRPTQKGRTGGYTRMRTGATRAQRAAQPQAERRDRPGGRPQGPPRPGAPGRPPAGGFRRPGGPPPPRNGAPSTTPAEGKNKTGKKFFKAKKKASYQKSRRDTVQERDFQIKKRPIKKVNPVPKEIDIMEVITVSELARKMNLKAGELISKLMGMGMMVTINQQIDSETAQLLAEEYGSKVKIVSLYDETIIESSEDTAEDLKPRPPIVTIMGHVDHGKTKLLDSIRTTDVVGGEFGGITQHIGAYKVRLADDSGDIVFLDTPGHEAFTQMRARGAQVTDIVVLVVAANDGVMPQTIEAINHAKAADVPIIVAINKIDLPEANPDRVKQQLSDYGLMPESWGGSTLFCEVSALSGDGVPELLETINLQSEFMELKANYNCRAEGRIIESKVDHGRGIVGTVIVERGTLSVGDAFVAGVFPGKVRAMFDDKGNKVTSATPATPVEVLGFTGTPNSGDPFQVTENEKFARQVGAKRQELEKAGEAKNVKKITLDNLYDSIQQGSVQELKVIIKGDVHGSVEALQSALERLSTPEIRLNVIDASAGAVTESNVSLAAASDAIIIAFHVRPTPKAQILAEQEKVEIRKYTIIYDAVDDIRDAMEGMLTPDLREETIGTVEVRETFKVPKLGLIAGCYITTGKVIRGATVHVVRDGIELHTGKITSLKRFKDDAREVAAGYECGIGIENYLDVQIGDTFEVIEMREVAKKLSSSES
jgi:translation initiation factor IF-2